MTASPPPQPVAAAKRCRVLQASYGGRKTVLILARASEEVRYTALSVLDGFERSMFDNYVRVHEPSGASVGEFASREEAVAKAKELCAAQAAEFKRASAG